MEAKVIYIMYCAVLENYNWSEKYAAVCLPSRATLTTNSGERYSFADPNFTASGEAVAELAFGACGLNMRPEHGEDWSARSIC